MDQSFASSSAHTLDEKVVSEVEKLHLRGQEAAASPDCRCRTSQVMPHYPPSTPHLNPNNLLILSHQSRGRGVYASRPLRAGTVVEISPVLIFGKEEWEHHGSKTLLDCYTFKWGRMGEMALALGLGSLFNHSASPSVSFHIDRPSHSIRYTLARDVVAGEELCISYGPWGKQYEEGYSNSDSGDVSDCDERKEREIADFLRIGEERSDSEGEPSNPRRAMQRKVVRRTRTRYIDGIGPTSLTNSNNGSGSDSGLEPARRGLGHRQTSSAAVPSPAESAPYLLNTNSASNVKRSSSSPSPYSGDPTQSSATASVSTAAPIWRLSSLPDPMTVPLQLLSCYALLIPPRSSSDIMKFIKKHSVTLGRGKTPGSEEDSIRHAKTLMKHPDDGGNLRALLCPTTKIEEVQLKKLLQEEGLMIEDDEGSTLLLVDVASTPAPVKTRAVEWSTTWPVALRSIANSPNLAAAPSTSSSGASGPSGALPAAASAIHASTRPGFIDRKIDAAFWSERRVQWVVQKLARCVLLAQDAKERGEVPVGVHVCPSILATAIMSNGGTGLAATSLTSSSSSSNEQLSDCAVDATFIFPEASATDTSSGAVSTFASPWYGGWDSDGIPFPGGEAIEVDAFDTRRSQRNPIKHAVGNAIQRVAELRAFKRGIPPNINSNGNAVEPGSRVCRGRSSSSEVASLARQQDVSNPHIAANGDSRQEANSTGPSLTAVSSLSSSPARPASPSLPLLLNGQDYLLTSLTLFTTHEPCVYCCMSLVHSRVRTLIFLESSPGSGGCCGSQLPLGKRCNEGLEGHGEGGPYALQEQRGLNHRFEVWKWRGGKGRIEEEVTKLRGSSGEGLKDLLDLKTWGMIDP